MKKKAQLELGTVLDVMSILLVMGVFVLAMFLALSSIRDVTEDIDRESGTISNENLTLSDKGTNNGTSVALLNDVALTNLVVTNLTAIKDGNANYIIASGNYTVTGGYIAPTTA